MNFLRRNKIPKPHVPGADDDALGGFRRRNSLDETELMRFSNSPSVVGYVRANLLYLDTRAIDTLICPCCKDVSRWLLALVFSGHGVLVVDKQLRDVGILQSSSIAVLPQDALWKLHQEIVVHEYCMVRECFLPLCQSNTSDLNFSMEPSPLCHDFVHRNGITSALATRKEVDALRVHCPGYLNGCTWTGRRKLLPYHLAEECNAGEGRLPQRT